MKIRALRIGVPCSRSYFVCWGKVGLMNIAQSRQIRGKTKVSKVPWVRRAASLHHDSSHKKILLCEKKSLNAPVKLYNWSYGL